MSSISVPVSKIFILLYPLLCPQLGTKVMSYIPSMRTIYVPLLQPNPVFCR